MHANANSTVSGWNVSYHGISLHVALGRVTHYYGMTSWFVSAPYAQLNISFLSAELYAPLWCAKPVLPEVISCPQKHVKLVLGGHTSGIAMPCTAMRGLPVQNSATIVHCRWWYSLTVRHSPPPQVVICDFGLAHTNSTIAAAATTTRHGAAEAPNTLLYTSPERSLPPPSFAPSFQDDVYAFGILMYFIATSETPFTGIPAAHLLEAIRQGARPQGLEAWVLRAAPSERHARTQFMHLAQECWQQDPDRRPSFGSIVARLTALCHEVRLLGPLWGASLACSALTTVTGGRHRLHHLFQAMGDA
jgi:serine/threonine protein kinase